MGAPHNRRSRNVTAVLRGPLTLLIVLIGVRSGDGQIVRGDARAIGMGQTGIGMDSSRSGVHNPALLATSTQTSASFAVRQLYGLEELRIGSAHLTIPIHGNALAVSGTGFGFAGYREIRYGAGIGTQFGDPEKTTLHIGIRTTYQIRSSRNEILSRRAYWHMGTYVPWSTHAGLGVTVASTHPDVGASVLWPPQIVGAGGWYRIDPSVLIAGDLIRWTDTGTVFRTGIEVSPHPVFSVRTGVTTRPTQFSAGIGIHPNAISVDIGSLRHPVLGWSVVLSLTLQP